jgi:cysteinyl-tRNA synthetase
MLRTHYRSPFNFSDANLDDAKAALRRLYTALDKAGAPVADRTLDWAEPRAARFRDAMNDDFNTPIAVAVLFELATEANRDAKAGDARLLRALGGVLGILQQEPRAYLQGAEGVDAEGIARRIEERLAAKRAGDYARADAIRKELAGEGIVLKDSAAGTTWVRA